MSLMWIQVHLIPDTAYPESTYDGFWPVPNPCNSQVLFSLAGLIFKATVGWLITLDHDTVVSGRWDFAGRLFAELDPIVNAHRLERFKRYPPGDPFQFCPDLDQLWGGLNHG